MTTTTATLKLEAVKGIESIVRQGLTETNWFTPKDWQTLAPRCDSYNKLDRYLRALEEDESDMTDIEDREAEIWRLARIKASR